jgi:hypothetical protein
MSISRIFACLSLSLVSGFSLGDIGGKVNLDVLGELMSGVDGGIPDLFNKHHFAKDLKNLDLFHWDVGGKDKDKDERAFVPLLKEFEGTNQGELSARWWQWALSIPADMSPLSDTDGSCTNGANNQEGPIWWLAGVFNLSDNDVKRNCDVPSDKAFFFPIVNVFCSALEDGLTAKEWREACWQTLALVDPTSLVAELDGESIVEDQSELQWAFKVGSPVRETGPLPKHNLLDAYKGKNVEFLSDGFFVLLKPLSPGMHTVRFAASVPQVSFSLDVTYNLNVVDKNKYQLPK